MENSVLVERDLGRGQNGYLEFILLPEQYSCISGTAFIHPTNPGRTTTIP